MKRYLIAILFSLFFFLLLLTSCAKESVMPVLAVAPLVPPNNQADNDPRWWSLHADQERTDSVKCKGVRKAPLLLFDRRDSPKAIFSGTMVGPKNDLSLGVGSKLYRCMGPGPISFNPPDGIPFSIGFTSRIEVRHPQTGRLLNYKDFNLGLFTNFPTVDNDGNVYIPDWARLTKYSPGLGEKLWSTTFPNLFIQDRFSMVPAGTMAMLSDGYLLLPFLGGRLAVLDPRNGKVVFEMELKELDPPVPPDTQLGALKIRLRNAAVVDGNDIFLLTADEMIRLRYNTKHELIVTERTLMPGFSSSTPTLDINSKRMFLVTYDPKDPKSPPMLRCFDYGQIPMKQRWAIETEVAHFESEDQLTVTYLPSSGVILNNALYGHVTAYLEKETNGKPTAELLWSTSQTVSKKFAAYISSASDLDNTVYVTDNFIPRLYALDGLTGKVLWSHDLPDRSIKTPIVAPGVIYLDHHKGILAIIEGR